MKRARWQKFTAFNIAIAACMYLGHVHPEAASAIVIGGIVPLFGAFVTGNVIQHRAEAKAP